MTLPQSKLFLTFIDLYVRPDVHAFAGVNRFAQLEGQHGYARNLLGIRSLETRLDEDVVCEAPDCGRKDDPGLRISYTKRRLITEIPRTPVPRYLLAQRPR